MFILSVWVAAVICLCFQTSEATKCVPYSKFKIDCNNCTCNYNGWEYSCSNYICPPIPYEKKYYVHQAEDGHFILKPKEETLIFDDNNKFVTLDRPQNAFRKIFAYINDEIPSNDEQTVNEENSNVYNVKIGRKIPILNDRFDMDERFDFGNINNEESENNQDENERFDGDDESDQNEDYDNNHKNKAT